MTPLTTIVQATGPLDLLLEGYDRTKPPGLQSIPGDEASMRVFLDAMMIREAVFVQEQSVPLENELDDQDASCVHMVLYTSDKEPIGTIRILPLDDTIPSILDHHRNVDGSSYTGAIRSAFHKDKELYVTFGRLAILKQHRGHGHAELLVRHAITHAANVWPGKVAASSWSGLTMIHAQQQVQRFWARVGFETDTEFGIWDEEGIDHVAMFTRI